MANMNAGMSEAPRSSVVPTMGRSALANELWRLPARLRQTLELRDWVIDTVDVVVSTFVVFTDPHEDRWLDERLNCLQSQILGAHPVPGRVAGHLRVSDDDAVILRRSVRRGIAELRVQRDTNGSSGPASSVTSTSINAAITCKPAPTANASRHSCMLSAISVIATLTWSGIAGIATSSSTTPATTSYRPPTGDKGPLCFRCNKPRVRN